MGLIVARTANRALLAQIALTLARDTGTRLDTTRQDDCIAQALDEFNRRRPRRIATASASCPTGNGTARIDISTAIPTYLPGFSRALSLEYPIDQDPESFVDHKSWTVDDELLLLKTTGGVIASGAKYRLRHTTPHTVKDFPDTGGSTTLTAADFEALGLLVAVYFCEALASTYANTVDTLVNADVVNNRTKTQEYEGRARNLRARFEERMTAPPASQAPASSFASLDVAASDGAPYLADWPSAAA